jgi:hypothetical protein
MAQSPQRFRDDGRSHFSYLDEILVTCPKCAAAGHVLPVGVSRAHPKIPAFAPRRFYCPGCNHRAESGGGIVTFGTDGRDPYLRLALRLQARTRHGVLYAYNRAHLDWIEAFVAAPAKNREGVLRALTRLRRRLADAS